jgi:hypothetical protein
MGETDKYKTIIIENMNEKAHFVDVSVDGKIIFKWTLTKLGERIWNGLSWLKVRFRWLVFENVVMNRRVS